MARLAGGGALQSDTCNGARKAKRLLAAMITEQAREVMGEEAWDKPTEEQQKEMTRVHELDCYQHLRNIFLKEMSSAQAAHVAAELKPHFDSFSSWDRMSTDYTQLLRSAYKELHQGNVYYKGKGREFWVWLEQNYPAAFAIQFERAEGGRQVSTSRGVSAATAVDSTALTGRTNLLAMLASARSPRHVCTLTSLTSPLGP